SSHSVGMHQATVTPMSRRSCTILDWVTTRVRLSAGTTVAPACRAPIWAWWPVGRMAYGVRTSTVSEALSPIELRVHRSTTSYQSFPVKKEEVGRPEVPLDSW